MGTLSDTDLILATIKEYKKRKIPINSQVKRSKVKVNQCRSECDDVMHTI